MVSQIHCKNVKLIFGGDVTFSGVFRYHVRRTKCTYNQSFTKIKPYLSKADHVIVNLETPFKQNDEGKQKELDPSKLVWLISDLDAMRALSYAGIDMVTLANNHFIDFGGNPANTTVKNLRKLIIQYMGVTYEKTKFAVQKPLIINKNGIKIGLLAYCAVEEGCLVDDYRSKVKIGPAVYEKNLARVEITSLRQSVDVVIIFMHWGDEYSSMLPSSSGKYIAQMAPLVDVIVGCHPHVTQNHFYHKGTLIVPSLGNMLFPLHGSLMQRFRTKGENTTSLSEIDRVWYKETKLLKNPTAYGKLVKVVLNKNGVVRSKTAYLPIEIDVNRNHCAFIKNRGKWRTLCGQNDKNCFGTDTCNEIECDKQIKIKPMKDKLKKTKHPIQSDSAKSVSNSRKNGWNK